MTFVKCTKDPTTKHTVENAWGSKSKIMNTNVWLAIGKILMMHIKIVGELYAIYSWVSIYSLKASSLICAGVALDGELLEGYKSHGFEWDDGEKEKR